MTIVTLIRVMIDISDRWAVGAPPLGSSEIHLPVMIDPRYADTGAGRPHVPGTSLAGSLRRHLGADMALMWLGPPPAAHQQSTGNRDRSGGRLVLLGVQPEAGMAIETRGSTAIDRTRRSAIARSLRFEQTVTPGALSLYLEHPGTRDEALITALRSWEPVIGRSRTQGLGRAQVSLVECLTVDLSAPEQLQWWLTHRSEWADGGASAPAGLWWNATAGLTAREGEVANRAAESGGDTRDDPRPARQAVLDLTWSVEEPVHVGVEEPISAGSSGPAVARTMQLLDQAVIPGSSWKGVFRHRVEHILDSVGATPEARTSVVDVLFGSQERRGVLHFADSVACDAPTPLPVRTHAPVDRFTGGAANGLLHTVEATPSGTFDQMVWATQPIGPALRNLLAHVVNDIDEGLLTVGGRGSRGYGRLSLAASGNPLELAPVVVSAIEGDVRRLLSPVGPRQAETDFVTTTQEGIGS